MINDDDVKDANSLANETTVTTFFKLFKGRTDVVGLATTKSTPVNTPEALLQNFRNHLNGVCRLGSYNLLPDGTCTWAMIELEDHGNHALADPRGKSLEALDHLNANGVHCYRERSKNASDKCYHVWIFFEKPILAETIHVAFNAFTNNTFGISTEVFPKGHDAAGIGNFVWLPFFPSRDNWGLGSAEGRTVFIDDNEQPYANQFEFLGSVRRVSEDVFCRFIENYKLPATEQAQSRTVQSGEGAADLANVRECAFMKYCKDNAQHLPEPLWYAWITNAVYCKGGREYIHEYSSKYPRYSKRETNRKITHALRDSGPMTHSVIEKSHGYKCTCPERFKSPISRATYIDVQVECTRLSTLSEEEKSTGVKKLVRYINKLDSVDKALAKAHVKKILKLDSSIFKETASPEETIDCSKDLTEVLGSLRIRGADDVSMAMGVYSWFRDHDKAQYFTDESGRHYMYVDRKLVPIAEQSNDFQALLLKAGEISVVTQFGRIVTQVMNASAHSDGKRIRKNTWLETKESELTVFLNLKNEENQLLKISPDSCSVINNGNEAEGVLMLNTQEDKLKPIHFLPLNDQELKEALDKCERLVVKHIPCIDHEKWFAYAWRLSYPLYDFTTMHMTLRAQGKQSQGKTTACKVLTLSLYGEMYENNNTVASLYSDASVNPLIVEDNLENRRFYSETGHADFYLSAATGGGKQKRDTSTDSGLVIEKIRSLLLCNGIESIAKSEQTSRMMIMECNKDKYNSRFTSAVLLDIKCHRDEMLSANYILTQRVLSRMKDGDWEKVQQRLLLDYPDHPKSRMVEHLSIVVLYLEEMFKAMDSEKQVWDLVKKWMDSQKDTAVTEIIESDPIIQTLDIIRDSAWKQLEYDDSHYGDEARRERSQVIKLDVRRLLSTVSFSKDTFMISGKAGELLSAFSQAHDRHLGKAFPIDKPVILAQRISNIEAELEAHGYSLIVGQDGHNKQKTYAFEWIPFKEEKIAA